MFPSQIPQSAVVKSTVKASMKGKEITAVIAAMTAVIAGIFLFMMASGLSVISNGKTGLWIIIVSAALFVLIIHPVILGTVRYFWRLSSGADDSPAEVFYYFTSPLALKRALKAGLLMLFKCFTAIFTCLLPYLVVTVLSNSWIYRFLGTEVPLWVAGLALVQSFLRIVGIFAGLAVISRYYLFAAIVVMDDDMLLLEAMHISVMVSRRSVSAFLALAASLFGWIIVSTLALPLLYTAPLFFGCYVVHCRYALVNYNMNLDYYTKEHYSAPF